MGPTTSAQVSPWIIAILLLPLLKICNATDFAQCQANVKAALSNGTISSNSLNDPIYHGLIGGLNVSPQPLLLTLEGCKRWCGGNAPQFSSSVEAFEILTTWVLPVITLLSSLPYESTSRHGFGNFEAFVNWIGAPAATLSTTLWNIRMMHKCRVWYKKPKYTDTGPIVRDTLYILSCINQYEYPRRDAEGKKYLRRDTALLRGTLFPYLNSDILSEAEQRHLANITQHLAFQLRLLRRRGVYPLAFGMFWFFLSLVFSIVISFDTSLGSNSEAHSLALGLLLAWLPVLVFTAYLDRNPVSSMRCAIMIERWLGQVEALFDRRSRRVDAKSDVASSAYETPSQISTRLANGADQTVGDTTKRLISNELNEIFTEHAERVANPSAIRSTDTVSEDPAEIKNIETESRTQYPNETSFKIGRFIGQGRKIRYCAVTDTVLSMAMDDSRLRRLPSEQDAIYFQQRLPQRPYLWYIIWCLSFLTVAVGFTTAFVITYQTPPIGVGCRCLSYLIWYAPSTVSWALLGLFQEPGPLVHASMCIANGLSTIVLIVIMLLQVTHGLNNCWCKSVTFVPQLVPGYMDFDDGRWLQAASHIRETWGVATLFGLLGSVGALLWLTWGYEKDKSLWHVNEDEEIELIEGVNLDWLR